MNENRFGATNAVVEAGMCTALSVVLSMLGFYMPLISTIVFLLIPLPLAYLGMRQGAKWSIIVATGVLILDSAFFGIVSAAFICAIFGVLGVVMGICYNHRVSAVKTLLAGALVVLAALVGEALAATYVLGFGSALFDGGFYDQMENSMMSMLPSIYSGVDLQMAQDKVSTMMTYLKKSIPFALIAASFFYAWASMTFGKILFRRLGVKDIPQLPPLERWEMPRWFVLLYILVIAADFAMNGKLLPHNELAETVLYNLGLLCVIVFWIQGLATLWWLPHRYPVIRPFRVLIVILSLFIGLLQTFLIFLGLADMVVLYRKKRNYQ